MWYKDINWQRNGKKFKRERKMKIINWGTRFYNGTSNYNCIVLLKDDWDDFNYKTTFEMLYIDENGEVHNIGYPKIYDKRCENNVKQHTCYSMDNDIKQLQRNYCSIGGDLTYYSNLKKYCPTNYMEVLTRLRDMAIDDVIRDEFIKYEGVNESLLRFSNTVKALNDARNLVINSQLNEHDISFEYKLVLEYSIAKFTFDFHRNKMLPNRINCIVGKNGVGKTRLLSKLSDYISGYGMKEDIVCERENRPLVDKVIAITYSAFDEFKKEKGNEKERLLSYVYCGIQSENGTLTPEELANKIKRAFERISKWNRVDVWKKLIIELLESEELANELIINLAHEKETNSLKMSSGQYILAVIVTELIASIEMGSIILFDEPEVHLHPNAIANIMRVFNIILKEFKSYMIISTHSPIVLQEVPSRYIHIMDRVEEGIIVRKPEIECFGNNISEITTEIFRVKDNENNYKVIIDELLKEYTKEEIISEFNEGLSMNALIYLHSRGDK